MSLSFKMLKFTGLNHFVAIRKTDAQLAGLVSVTNDYPFGLLVAHHKGTAHKSTANDILAYGVEWQVSIDNLIGCHRSLRLWDREALQVANEKLGGQHQELLLDKSGIATNPLSTAGVKSFSPVEFSVGCHLAVLLLSVVRGSGGIGAWS